MKRLLTLVFVAALAFVGSAVYADGPAAVTTEAPIVIGPGSHGFGYHHGSPFGGQIGDEYGIPGQKPGILAKLGNGIKKIRAARAAKKAAAGYEFGGVTPPRRKLFGNRTGFNNGLHGNGFHGGYQEFPTEFQVGGYY